jgi:hypothetical protein
VKKSRRRQIDPPKHIADAKHPDHGAGRLLLSQRVELRAPEHREGRRGGEVAAG